MESWLSWVLIRHLRKVWVRVVSFAVVAVLTVGVAQLAAPFIPTTWTLSIGAEAVDHVLNILASSMLAVTTFSLAIATSAFAAAAQSATPRAVALLQADPTAQNVLATFLGAFLFSLVGIIALQAGYYDDDGRFVLFLATALVVALVVIALLRWISHLMSFGRMEDTLDRVERAAERAIGKRSRDPYLGGRPLSDEIPSSCIPVFPETAGYVQHVDVGALDACAEDAALKLWLAALPGTFVHPTRPVVFADRDPSEVAARLRGAVTVGQTRDFDQDPRFGLIVLTEIASRALSPAVNDPGTAIGVTGRLVRLLLDWNQPARDGAGIEIDHPRVFVPPIEPGDLLVDAFRPILRDGAGMIEVQLRLLKALDALAGAVPEFGPPAREMADDLRVRAAGALPAADLTRLDHTPTPHLR